eukprot:jgi/Mesvir1/25395/Mv01433-RA.2
MLPHGTPSATREMLPRSGATPWYRRRSSYRPCASLPPLHPLGVSHMGDQASFPMPSWFLPTPSHRIPKCCSHKTLGVMHSMMVVPSHPPGGATGGEAVSCGRWDGGGGGDNRNTDRGHQSNDPRRPGDLPGQGVPGDRIREGGGNGGDQGGSGGAGKGWLSFLGVGGRGRDDAGGDDDDDDDIMEDDAVLDWPPRSPVDDLGFFASAFAFLFGRGDENEWLGARRMRAISRLLRHNGGVVFAEQVAPYLDECLLGGGGGGAVSQAELLTCDGRGSFGARWAGVCRRLAPVTGVARPLLSLLRRWGVVRALDKEEQRDLSRMHEGYMLPLLARFGGHPEASPDGRLVYVFPSLQVTAIDAAAPPGSSASHAAGVSSRALPPPATGIIPPPIYERENIVVDGGEKQPVVIGLGVVNSE